MSPNVKKTSSQETKKLSKLASKEKIAENEKENIRSRLRLRGKKCVQQPLNALLESPKEREPKTLLTPLEPAVKVKSLGFWQKKLLDLEESITKKKCELYDFNETDESSSCKRKKIKKRGRQKKKKMEYKSVENFSKVSKAKKGIKEFHRNSLCREQIMLGKERKKLAAKGENFTFSTGIPSLGITSTPAMKKDNLVGVSNFLFLSPIIKEEVECYNRVQQSLSDCDSDNDNDTPTVNLNQETQTKKLKVETKLKRISCSRVLRSRKMLNT